MVIRVFQIQVVQSGEYASKLERQSLKRVLIRPDRGRILDRNGEALVLNADVKIKVKNNTRALKRLHPYGSLAGQVLGRSGKDGRGQMGIELTLDAELRGVDGWTYRKLDAKRRIYDGFSADAWQEATSGLDVILSIQKEIQEIAETALSHGVRDVKADRGAAIVLDPYTGDILAMASYPEFNPDARKVDHHRVKNDAISKSFEPGSTFKMITAAAALEEQHFSIVDTIDANQGVFKIYGDVIRDHTKRGRISFAEAMAYSSNVCFAKIAQAVGREEFYRYVRSFGFGMATGIDLPGEEKGKLKSLDNWSGRTLVTMAMGHEILATPLQMTMAYGAIANGGTLLRPRLIKELRTSRTSRVVQKIEVDSIRRVISDETAAKIRKTLEGVVEYGTARNLKSSKVSISGKTGTAEKYDVKAGRYLYNSQNSSFIGLIPAHNPKYVVMVVVDEPRTFTSGARTAGPIVKEIAEKLYYTPGLKKEEVAHVNHTKEMPNFSGMSKKQIEVLKTKYKISWLGDGNKVVKQSPKAGTPVRDGSVLELTLDGFKNSVKDSLTHWQEHRISLNNDLTSGVL
jgi:cell division protein FtsI/penicillin-binding protein 2